MIYYVVSFSLALFFAECAKRLYRNKILFFFSIIFSIAPLVLLVSLRDWTVGSDTMFYQIPVWNLAKTYHGSSFWKFAALRPGMEIGYLYANYIVSRYTHNIVWFYLCMYSIMLIPIYLFAFKFRKYLSPTLVLFFFCLLLYNESFSTIRQAVAMSISLLSVMALLKRKYLQAFLFIYISCLFHRTAFLILAFPVLYIIMQSFPVKKYRFAYLLFGFLMVTCAYWSNSLILWALDSGSINEKFRIYTTESEVFKGGLSLTYLLIKIVIFIYCWQIYERYRVGRHYILFCLIIASVDMVTTLLGQINFHLIRLTLYPRILSCFYLPFLYKNFSIKFKTPQGIIPHPLPYIIVLLTVFYWYYVYIHGDFASTSDYRFNQDIFGV